MMAEKLPKSIVSDLESLRQSISEELPAINQVVKLRNFTIKLFGQASRFKISFSSYATYEVGLRLSSAL